MSKKIGTVEILRTQIYPLDAESRDDFRSTVVVEAGSYELYSDGMATYWMMHGKLNQRGFWRMGDGLFSMNERDEPSDIEVVFPSKRFGPDEWTAFLAEPRCTEGDPSQRLRIRQNANVGST